MVSKLGKIKINKKKLKMIGNSSVRRCWPQSGQYCYLAFIDQVLCLSNLNVIVKIILLSLFVRFMIVLVRLIYDCIGETD